MSEDTKLRRNWRKFKGHFLTTQMVSLLNACSAGSGCVPFLKWRKRTERTLPVTAGEKGDVSTRVSRKSQGKLQPATLASPLPTTLHRKELDNYKKINK